MWSLYAPIQNFVDLNLICCMYWKIVNIAIQNELKTTVIDQDV